METKVRITHSPPRSPFVVPIAFTKYVVPMLPNAIKILGHAKIKIYESLIKLHSALQRSLEFNFLMEKCSHNDSLDSFILSLL